MAAVRPFEVAVAQERLDDLRRRLSTARLVDDAATDWDQGVPSGWLGSMVRDWVEWDWRVVEAEMNAHDHVLVDVGGQTVHAMVLEGRGPDPTPIVLTHGWPWTFWDYRHVARALADPVAHGGDAADACTVVVPSLPGYGFSTPLARPVDPADIADLWVGLMAALGHDRFAAQGGDWGAIVTSWLGHAHAERLLGVHLGMSVVPGVGRRDLPDEAWADDESWMRRRMAAAEPLIRSHVTVHSRDPRTLAHALVDSPVGLAAWLWERRRNWSDCDGDVESVFSRDELFTLASLYWLTDTLPSSLRLYFQHFNHPRPPRHDRTPTIEAPTAVAVFPEEVVFLPKSVLTSQTDLRRHTVMPAGGHFAPAEQPELLVDDVRAFLRTL